MADIDVDVLLHVDQTTETMVVTTITLRGLSNRIDPAHRVPTELPRACRKTYQTLILGNLNAKTEIWLNFKTDDLEYLILEEQSRSNPRNSTFRRNVESVESQQK